MTASVMLVAWLTAAAAMQLPSSPAAVVEGYVRAWNTHDGPAFGRLYADDADWVMASGTRLKGRRAVEAALTKEHSSWARTTVLKATEVAVRQLGPDRAIVMYAWEITSDAPAAARISRGNTVLTVAKATDGWVIVAGQVASVAQAAGSTADRDQITAILSRWEEAWNTHDMTAFASLFHEDGVWILWTGEVWTGRKVIEDGHAAVHKTIFRNSIQRELLEELTFVGPDAAVVRFCSILTGSEQSPDEPIRSRKFLVVTRRQGVWKMSWGQNTRLRPDVPDSECFAALRKRGG